MLTTREQRREIETQLMECGCILVDGDPRCTLCNRCTTHCGCTHEEKQTAFEMLPHAHAVREASRFFRGASAGVIRQDLKGEAERGSVDPLSDSLPNNIEGDRGKSFPPACGAENKGSNNKEGE